MMQVVFRIAAAGLVLAACAATALAGDYPFSGYLTISGSPATPDPLDIRRCALNFFTQEKNGGFTGYHVDLDRFKTTKEVRYVVYQRGTCAYSEKASIETCNMSFDTDPESQGRIFVDVIEKIGEATVETTAFDEVEQAEAYASGGKKDGDFLNTYFRCPFDAGKITAALSTDTSTLPIAQRDVLTGPIQSFLEDQQVIDLTRAIGLTP